MTEEPTVEPWWDGVIAFIQKRERTAVLRKKLAEARAAGKERRNRERLRKRVQR